MGIFENVWRFSNLVSNQIYDTSFQIVLQIVLFAVIGLFIGLFGWKVNQFQHDVQVCVRIWIFRHFGFLISGTSGIEQDMLQSDVQNASTGENSINSTVTIL